jgi:tetratricopeptide (TPR) repeat protein
MGTERLHPFPADRMAIRSIRKQSPALEIPLSFGRDQLLGLVLILAVVLTYQPLWHAGFIWDDDDHVTANPCIVGPLGLKEIWTTSAARYYPLVLTTFWAEHALWGLNPLLFHLVNVLAQAACAVVLWRVLLSLRVPGAWLGAALWALHPVQVESVAWISELKNVQSGLFYLLSILFFVKGLRAKEKGDPVEDRRNYALMLFFAALAMMSKSSTVILPLVLCLCAWWVEGRWNWHNLGKLAPVFLMSLATALLALWSVQLYGIVQGPQATRSLSERLVTSGYVPWFYLGKLLWPHPLIFIYPRWQIEASRALSYWPLLAMVVVAIVFWSKRQSWARPWFFALAYFLVALIPVLGLINHYFLRYSFVADHLQYLASMGPLALVGAGLTKCADYYLSAKAWLRSTLCAVILLLLGALSWQRTWVYLNQETLWTDTLAQNSNCWLAHNNLGDIFLQKGDVAQAQAHFETAIKINPTDPLSHYNLGAVFSRKEDIDAAVAQFQKALQINPGFVLAHVNLGQEFVRKGQVDDGIAQYQSALAINPNFALAHIDLGLALGQKGDNDAMIAQFRAAVLSDPGFAPAHYNLGFALFQKGQLDDAIDQYQKAIDIDPSSADAHNNLGLAFAQKGLLNDAAAQYQMALQIAPNMAEAHYNLGNALLRGGQIPAAIGEFQSAVKIDPDYADAHNNLAIALYQSGRLNDAIVQFQEFVRLSPGNLNAQKNLARAQAMARQMSSHK